MNFKISANKKLPEGVKLAKGNKKVKLSETEYFPLTKMNVGDSFYAPGYVARDFRGIIHKKSRTRGMKFVSKTEQTKNGYGTRVYRIK